MADKSVNINIIAKDKTQAALGSVQKSLSGIKNRVFNLRNALIGIGGAAVLKGFLNAGIEVENLGVQLNALFGSAERGTKALQQVTKFAAQTPFELRNIQQGITALATVSDRAEETGISFDELLKITGNTATVLGGDFALASLQIQRAFSNGIASADTFRDRGVSAMAGFESGTRYSIEKSIEGLRGAFGSGGTFGQLTEELAKTTFGTISNLKDAFFQFQVAVASGFFPALKSELGDFKKTIEDNNEEIRKFGESLGKNIVQGFEKSKKVINDLKPSLQFTGRAFKNLYEGYDNLPEEVKNAGLIVALLFGKKGVLALGAISGVSKLLGDYANEIELFASKVSLKLAEFFNLPEEYIVALQEMVAKAYATIQSENAKNVLQIKLNIKFDMLKNQLQSQMESFKDATKEVNEELTFMEKLFKDIEKKADKFSTSLSVVEQSANIVVNSFVTFKKSVSEAFADAILKAKSFEESMRALGQTILRQVIAGIVQIALEVFIFDRLKEKIKEMNEELGKSSRLMAHLKLTQEFGIFGFMGGFALPTPRAAGGNVRAGQPYMVGEAGHEMFVPSENGNIVPNNQLGGGQNINITINANDTQGFDELLVKRRATIVNVINDALNSQGKEALV